MSASLRRIMYIEDDPDIQAIARLALEEVGGFEVAICGSGGEALRRLRDFRPDLILLDVMLPGMDGLSTLTLLRQNMGDALAPVVFITARLQAPEMAAYRRAGALGIIAKPFDPVTLPEQLARIWEGRHDRH